MKISHKQKEIIDSLVCERLAIDDTEEQYNFKEIGTFQRLLGQFPELLGSVAPEQFHAVLSQGAVSRMKGLGLRV